ncbi:hypothetical protein M8C21_019257 [Ambrosia artemisiifolia]|uniref:Uncharacterized protein n=1 Tax=Ambrosia artemisiifolia TaxID=4212 RepID=A0AAD5BLM4_AMBAR|nr:hypothetical protein M8C21_019257 [Ambrosia artemisiifolia]
MGVVFGPINDENSPGLLEDFIEKAGGCAVIDGGFATQLELHGASIKDPLWSALCLINNPHLISKGHDEHEKTLDGFLDFLVVSLAVTLRKKPTTPVTNQAAASSSEKGKRKKHCHGSSNPAAANSLEKGKRKKLCHGSSNPTEATTNSSEKGLVWHNHEDED